MLQRSVTDTRRLERGRPSASVSGMREIKIAPSVRGCNAVGKGALNSTAGLAPYVESLVRFNLALPGPWGKPWRDPHHKLRGRRNLRCLPQRTPVPCTLAKPAPVIVLTNGGYPLPGQGVPGAALGRPRVARF